MIHHIEIYVSDLDKSRTFYEFFLTKLNYKIFQEWDKGFSFKDDNSYIVFVQTEENYLNNQFNRKNTGLNHLAFKVLDLETFETIKKELLDFGVTELYKNMNLSSDKFNKLFFFEDPDRIKLELVY